MLSRLTEVPVVRPLAERVLRHVFDSLAGRWEQIRRDPTYRAGLGEMLDELPAGFTPERVLDAACGTGIAAAMVVARWPNAKVDGIDIAPAMVAAARELVPSASFQVASVHELPFAAGSCDLVVLLDGIVDVGELYRVTRPGGVVLVVYSRRGTTPVARNIDGLTARCTAAGFTAHAIRGEHAHAVYAAR